MRDLVIATAFAGLVCVSAAAFGQECPAGSRLVVNKQGTQVGKPRESGRTPTTDAPITGCPTGTVAMFDNQGKQVCRKTMTEPSSEPAKPCAPNTYPTFDNPGKRSCRHV